MEEFLQSADLWLPGLVAMLCLTVVSGFFSGSETALFYLSNEELRWLRTGTPRQRTVAQLLRDPDRLLTGILFWNLVVNLTFFAVSVVVTQRLVRHEQTAAAGVYGILSLFFLILLGEVVPKSMAVVFRLRLAPLVSWPLALSVRLLDPILPLLLKVSRIARRTFWPHIPREPHLEAADLERAVEASRLSTEVVRLERQVLHNILDLSEVAVEEVMRPRGTYVALHPPVHRADLKGELPAADYLILLQDRTEDVQSAVPLANLSSLPERHLEQAAEKVLHVPWCATLAGVLQMMRDRDCSLAAIVNEYGENIGIVTYEDILDNILLPDPSRARRLLRREPVITVGPDRYEVEGITTLRYLCRRLGMEYEPTADELVTVSGMLHEELEHLPVVGDECDWRGYRIRVIEAPQRGHVRVLLWKEEQPTDGRPHPGNGRHATAEDRRQETRRE